MQLTGPNSLELFAPKDSKISNVSLYSGRAEVTRVFAFELKAGSNSVTITGLPTVLDEDSFRVEGHGAATIHDVILTTVSRPVVYADSPTLGDLNSLKMKKEKALERAGKALKSLDAYMKTITTEHTDATLIGTSLDESERVAEKWDVVVLDLKDELKKVDEDIEEEKLKLAKTDFNEKLMYKASILIHAENDGQAEIALIYAVRNATWSATYDIRVDMQTKETPVTLIYKAGITQNTGEDWSDVSLALETATPTFGLNLPDLTPWTLSVYRPPVLYRRSAKKSAGFSFGAPSPSSISHVMERGEALDTLMEKSSDLASQAALFRGGAPPPPPRMTIRQGDVSSKGDVSATFSIPGLTDIPSDDVAHKVTIAELKLGATMSWAAVPKKDARVHLKAKIINSSDYTFLQGPGSVYVDGSFIARSEVPLVSPGENFDCPLGLDPSIRITYHPLIKKVSQSGFYNKTSNIGYTQRITIFNTKRISAENIKVHDQVPISETDDIVVKVISPSISLPEQADVTANKVPNPVKVSDSISLQWDGADEDGVDLATLGKDGKVNWLCSVPSQEKVNLTIQWEVSAPSKVDISGLR